MDMLRIAVVVVVSYLIGSISFSRLAFRILAPGREMKDIELPVPGGQETYKVTATGSSSVSMVLGSRAGCTVGLLDMLKAAVPTLWFKYQYPAQPYFLLAAVAAMIGHNWPIFYRFRGGRGVSAVYGSLLVIDPLGAVVCAVAGMLVGLLVLRDFLVAYLSGLWLLIPWMWLRARDLPHIAYALALNFIFVLAMVPDLRQYLEFRHQGRTEMVDVMSTMPMGRGMMKMMQKLHLMKE